METQCFTLKDVIEREEHAQSFSTIHAPNNHFGDYIGSMDICLFFPWYTEEATVKKIYLKVFAHVKHVHYQTQILIGYMNKDGIVYELMTDEQIEKSLQKIHLSLQKKSKAFAFKLESFFCSLFNS